MGNLHTIYIKGEVDFEAMKTNNSWLYKTNFCLKYPQFFIEKPSDLSIDHNNQFNQHSFLISEKDLEFIWKCYSLNQNSSIVVLLQGTYSDMAGYVGLKIIDSKIIQK